MSDRSDPGCARARAAVPSAAVDGEWDASSRRAGNPLQSWVAGGRRNSRPPGSVRVHAGGGGISRRERPL